jgi:ABC-type nitrate/sulfonate/bicarbonate transport system permease component
MATDYALPIAFIAMLFAELWASTAGLGFMMTIAGATSQADKGFAGFIITAVLLAGISAVLRSIVKMLCASVETRLAQTVSGP